VLCALLPPLTAPVLPAKARPRIAAPPAVQPAVGDADTTAPVLAPVDDSHVASSAISPTVPDRPAVTGKNDLIPQSPAPFPLRSSPLREVKIIHHTTAFRLTRAEWLCLIWLTGVVAMLIRTIVGLVGAERLIRSCIPLAVSPAITAMEEARRRLGVKVPVSVREGTAAAHVAVPMTFGGRRPVVLLPIGTEKWPTERLRVVMLHEMAHVGRRDWVTMMLAQAVFALYWFHPLVWLTARRLRTEAEAACDDLVLTHGVAAPDYAAHLLEVVRGLMGRRIPSSVVTMAYSHEIKARLTTILAEHRNRGSVGRHRWLLVLITTAALLVPLAALRPVSSAPPQSSGSGVVQEPAPLSVWAMASDHHVTAMMAGHSKWEQTLPNGIRVRLLAAVASTTRGDVECSWTPEGTVTVPLNPQLVRTYGPGSCQFLCGIVFPSARLQNEAIVSGGTAGRAQWYTEGVPQWHGGQAVSANIWPDSPNAWAGNWAGQERGALELIIASGPKTTLIAAPPTQEAVRHLPTGELLTLSKPVVHKWPSLHRLVSMSEVTVTLPSRFVRHLTDYSFEVIGRDGRPLRVHHAGTTEPDTSKEMTHISFSFRTSEAPLDRVKEIRLMYRSSQTVVFGGVAMRPNAKAVPVVPIAPSAHAAQNLITTPFTIGMAGDQVSITKGVSLRLVGVSDRPWDNQRWWRPDGTPFIYDPKAFRTSYNIPPPNLASQPWSVFMFRLTQPEDDVDFDPWWPPRHARNPLPSFSCVDVASGSILSGSLRAVPDGPNSQTVRLRLAAGPWRQERVILNPTEGMTAVGYSGNGWLGSFELRRLSPSTTSVGITPFAQNEDRNEEARVVAIDRQGRQYLPGPMVIGPLLPGNPPGPTTRYPLSLPLSQIKKLAVETRLYREIDVKGIARQPKETPMPQASVPAPSSHVTSFASPSAASNEPSAHSGSVQTLSWRMTVSNQYSGDWPHGLTRKASAKTTWVRRDAPAIAASGEMPGWMSLRDAHGSRVRSPSGNVVIRKSPTADERNEVAYLVDRDIQLFVGFSQEGAPPQSWRMSQTVLDGRPAILYSGHWPLRSGTEDVDRWIDPATHRLMQRKVVISVTNKGRPVFRSVSTWSDVRYNQPAPPGVLDWPPQVSQTPDSVESTATWGQALPG
jgi:beta-lactamase regulating signal transducer with metallopeptidase domain